MNRLRVCLIVLTPALLLLSGCGTASGQVKAITDAIVSYSDYYIEVRNLDAQVREQYKTHNPEEIVFDYTITADIPDYTRLDMANVPYQLPSPDFSALNVVSYRHQASFALRQALESYALEGSVGTYRQVPVSISVTQSKEGWSAVLSSQSKLAIQQAVEAMVASVLEQNDTFRADNARMQVASALPGLLAEAFGGESYADLLTVRDVGKIGDGSYSVSFSFPEPAFVYEYLSEKFAASYNKPFYGDSIHIALSTDGIQEIGLANAPRVNASAAVSLDTATGSCMLLDDGGIAAGISAAKSQAEENISVVINGAWRVPALDTPSSGQILEGKSKGNDIVFKTNPELGKYFYVRLYKISGEDISEEGTLALGVFIKGGKHAGFRLPTGYYRVTCAVGEHWYGLEHLFGDDSTTFDGGNAIRSQNGYINTISFE
jgi:hypothetical protein